MKNTIETLRNENEFLQSNLPALQESSMENHVDLKDKIESLTMDLMDNKSKLEGELKKASEAEN